MMSAALRHPIIPSPFSEVFVVLSQAPARISFNLSFTIRCLSAGAGFLFARERCEGGTWPLGEVMVKSYPQAAYGIGGISVHLKEGTGRKKKSSGRNPGSPLTARFNSISTREPFPMMPAVFKRVQITGAVSSPIRSCIARLDTCTQ